MTRLLLVLLITIPIISCNNDRSSKLQSVNKDINGISLLKYTITNTYPHSIESYTEGLLFHDNKLFESTGSPENYPNTRSVIGIVNLKTGEIDVKVEIDRVKYFGEGILFFKNKLYQLTYKNQLGFIYDSKNFKQIGTFHYLNKEGWGMTTDGNSIIMSDGTNFITYWDPDSLKVIKKINITYNGSSALYANELEFINGFIYANIWTTNYIAKIDPINGKIVGLIDLTTLFFKAKKENPQSEATNGIAYDLKRNRIFVTGKFWPFIFEIKFQD
jgi:glutaminyl-peptide cyclotransferase